MALDLRASVVHLKKLRSGYRLGSAAPCRLEQTRSRRPTKNNLSLQKVRRGDSGRKKSTDWQVCFAAPCC